MRSSRQRRVGHRWEVEKKVKVEDSSSSYKMKITDINAKKVDDDKVVKWGKLILKAEENVTLRVLCSVIVFSFLLVGLVGSLFRFPCFLLGWLPTLCLCISLHLRACRVM